MLWVMEFQKRGAPHFHILVDKHIPHQDVAAMWYKIVSSGDEKHLKAGTRVSRIKNVKQVICYISKYLGKKNYQKVVPEGFENVGRFWGMSRGMLEFVEHVFEGSLDDLKRKIRTLRKWYKAKLRQKCGFKWRWKGQGFLCWDGMDLINALPT